MSFDSGHPLLAALLPSDNLAPQPAKAWIPRPSWWMTTPEFLGCISTRNKLNVPTLHMNIRQHPRLSKSPMPLSAIQLPSSFVEPPSTPVDHGPASSISAMVSHELRNALLAASTLLELDSSPSRDARRALELVNQAHSLSSLLFESLTVAYRPIPTQLTLEDWLPSIVRRFARQLPSTIRTSCEVAPGLPSVMVDPDALALVLRTLLINASIAQQGVGEVQVSARRPRTSEQADGMVEIIVRDRGPGFTHESLSSLFQTRARPIPTQDRAGLGLLLARQIMRQQGGDLHCLSADNPGGVLAIHLPASRSTT